MPSLEGRDTAKSRKVDGVQGNAIDHPHSPVELVRLLPLYARHPVVADANVLFQDVHRYTKTGFTLLTFLAKHEVITLLTCEHVRERVPQIIADRSHDPTEHMRMWREVYLPIVRFATVPNTMCAGHPQIEAIVDLEDRPFARLAIATAPGLLLTRDHHFSDVGLGTEQWADALAILRDLAELDAALYGGAHTATVLVLLAGQLTRWVWRGIASESLLWLAATGIGLLLLLDNEEEALRRARSALTAMKQSGARLLDATAPMLEQRLQAEGSLSSRLETPVLPRSLESACAREVATQRRPIRIDTLMDVCNAAGSDLSEAQLARFLYAHPSFTHTSARTWELGSLGLPVLDVEGP
jgi:hypothetical protein